MKRKFILIILVTGFILIPLTLYGFTLTIDYMPRNKYQVMGLQEMMKLDSVEYLVIHETANQSITANADAHKRLVHSDNPTGTLGTHVYIDNVGAQEVAPLDTMLWHTGGKKNADPIHNFNSIGIEMCVDTKLDEFGNPSSTLTKAAREQTYTNTIRYIQEVIFPLYPDIKVVFHHDVWGKDCPHFLRAEGRCEEFIDRIYNPTAQDQETQIEDIIVVDARQTFDQYFKNLSQDEIQFLTEEVKKQVDNSMPIMGYEPLDFAKVKAFILDNNPDPLLSCSLHEWLTIVDEACKVEDINPYITIAQSLVETAYFRFGGLVKPEQNNYSGHGSTGLPLADGTPDAGNWFNTPRDGIHAQVVHLLAYASTNDSILGEHYDDRFHFLADKRGSCPTIYSLAGNWAADPDYGFKIEAVISAMLTMNTPETIDITNVELIDQGLIQEVFGTDNQNLDVIPYDTLINIFE